MCGYSSCFPEMSIGDGRHFHAAEKAEKRIRRLAGERNDTSIAQVHREGRPSRALREAEVLLEAEGTGVPLQELRRDDNKLKLAHFKRSALAV